MKINNYYEEFEKKLLDHVWTLNILIHVCIGIFCLPDSRAQCSLSTTKMAFRKVHSESFGRVQRYSRRRTAGSRTGARKATHPSTRCQLLIQGSSVRRRVPAQRTPGIRNKFRGWRSFRLSGWHRGRSRSTLTVGPRRLEYFLREK